MHLMFSERIIDERTRDLPEEQFFKRNGAKKDRDTWHSRDKPDEIWETRVAMMNGAMERAGVEQRMDARSWAEQGRGDLHELRKPKLLGGEGRKRQIGVGVRKAIQQDFDTSIKESFQLPIANLERATREARSVMTEVRRPDSMP
jgi:hypothetical protein